MERGESAPRSGRAGKEMRFLVVWLRHSSCASARMSYSILRTALPVWSPREALLATGTISGALDETFSSESTLELWRPFEKAETPLAAVQASSRFTRLAWGAATPERASGVIAAGFENGEIALWDPARILADDGTESVPPSPSLPPR